MGLTNSGLGEPTEEEMAERLLRTGQIQDWAQRLLDDPACAAAFRRVGIGGEFTPEEQALIYEQHGLADSFEDVNAMVRLDYQAVAQALARRVAAGVFESALSEQAKSYVLERTLVSGFADGKSYNRIRDQRMSFEEFHTVLKEYMAWEKETGIVETIREQIRNYVHPEDSDDDWEETTGDMWGPLDLENARLFRKYGLIPPATVVSVAGILRRADKSPEDIEAVIEAVNLVEGSVFIKGITL
ncbi:hypothetical protein [Agrobacterium sp. NPDC090283]|uniref:hypothetical protein n=1 Tax=Agrobacterium sp. NPDC090283 TaxID=3363920 RepID=UPI00383AB370